MPTTTATSLISKALTDLLDPNGVRWERVEMLSHLNDGQVEVVGMKPDAYTLTTAFQLVAGSKQSVPSNCIQLQKIIRNMGTDGTTPGAVIPIIQMQQLDLVMPTWHTVTATSAVKHWMFEELNPKVFWVYPKNDGTGYVEDILCTLPPDVAAEGNTITIDDVYRNALYHYMMARAYAKDSDYAANQQMADIHYNLFRQSLLIKESREKAERPISGKAQE